MPNREDPLAPALHGGPPPAGPERTRESYPLLRSVARRLRREWTGLLHPPRRMAGQRLVRNLAPRSILFVCHGNINRSAYAGAYFRGISSQPVEVASAGFVGPGRSPPPLALEVARERGVSMEDHRSRLLEPGLVTSNDLIVVMDARQARALKARFGVPSARIVLLGDFDPLRPERRQVLDPVDRPRDDYERVFDRIERCVRELSQCL